MDISETTQELTAAASALWIWLIDFLPRLTSAVVVLVLGWLFARLVASGATRLLDRARPIDVTLRPIIGSVIRYTILIIVIVAALGQLGIQTASILAALGAAGIAIGLALQGTLANIAAGMMLLWLRPFRAGDFIEISEVAGTVEEVGLFTTQLRTWDGIYKFVPNSKLWNTTLTNYTRNPTRLIQIDFGVAYESDIANARRVLIAMAGSHAGVIKDPPPLAVPLSLGDSAVVIQLRAWAPVATFWDVRWELTEGGKAALDAAGITIPFPQRVVRLVTDGEPSEDAPEQGREAPPAARRAEPAQR